MNSSKAKLYKITHPFRFGDIDGIFLSKKGRARQSQSTTEGIRAAGDFAYQHVGNGPYNWYSFVGKGEIPRPHRWYSWPGNLVVSPVSVWVEKRASLFQVNAVIAENVACFCQKILFIFCFLTVKCLVSWTFLSKPFSDLFLSMKSIMDVLGSICTAISLYWTTSSGLGHTMTERRFRGRRE